MNETVPVKLSITSRCTRINYVLRITSMYASSHLSSVVKSIGSKYTPLLLHRTINNVFLFDSSW